MANPSLTEPDGGEVLDHELASRCGPSLVDDWGGPVNGSKDGADGPQTRTSRSLLSRRCRKASASLEARAVRRCCNCSSSASSTNTRGRSGKRSLSRGSRCGVQARRRARTLHCAPAHLAPERETEPTGARGGPIGATVQPQRVGAGLCRVDHPQQLEELLGPQQAPVSSSLATVRLAGVQHPPIVLKASRDLIRIGHHAEDVIEFEHGQEGP